MRPLGMVVEEEEEEEEKKEVVVELMVFLRLWDMFNKNSLIKNNLILTDRQPVIEMRGRIER